MQQWEHTRLTAKVNERTRDYEVDWGRGRRREPLDDVLARYHAAGWELAAVTPYMDYLGGPLTALIYTLRRPLDE